jgi:hypothetical protein
MIFIWNHEIARQRQQELLAAAERSRRARIAHDQNAQARTGTARTPMQRFSRVYVEFLAARLTFCGRDGYLRRNLIARSSAQVESSRDNVQRRSIVSPSALSFPFDFGEKPGECRHISGV